MDTRFTTITLSAALGLVMVLAVLPAEAGARNRNTTRWCNAFYGIRIESVDGKKVNYTAEYPEGRFSAKGACGKSVPNRCRARARDAAQACMWTHWGKMMDPGPPAACTTASNVFDYPGGQLRRAILRKVCQTICLHGREGGFVEYRVDQVSTGDKSCGNDRDKTRRSPLAGGKLLKLECTSAIWNGPCGLD